MVFLFFLPLINTEILKKTENAKNKYEIIEEENSLLLRYINNIKKTKAMNIIWVGMLKNYWDFNEDELDEIQEFLSEEDYYIIRPKKRTGNYSYIISKE